MADFKLNYTGTQINTILGNANTWLTNSGLVNNVVIGPYVKLPSAQTTLSLYTNNGAAANIYSGKLGLSDVYANLNLTNYRFHCMGDAMFTGQINNNLIAGGTFIAGTHEGSFNVKSAMVLGWVYWKNSCWSLGYRIPY